MTARFLRRPSTYSFGHSVSPHKKLVSELAEEHVIIRKRFNNQRCSLQWKLTEELKPASRAKHRKLIYTRVLYCSMTRYVCTRQALDWRQSQNILPQSCPILWSLSPLWYPWKEDSCLMRRRRQRCFRCSQLKRKQKLTKRLRKLVGSRTSREITSRNMYLHFR